MPTRNLLRVTRSIGLLASLIALRSAHPQPADTTTRHAWFGAGGGVGSLGPSAESSVWLESERLAIGLRWSQTEVGDFGSGDKHEFSALVGIPVSLWRSTLVAAAGIGVAGGCYTPSDTERCTSSGIEPAAALGLELDAPLSRFLGIHLAAFGAAGQRAGYIGVAAGLSIGRFP